MTAQVLHSPSHFPSSPSSFSCVPTNDSSHHHNPNSPSAPVEERDALLAEQEVEEENSSLNSSTGDGKEEDQLSLLALLLTLFRKSLVTCTTAGREELCSMEIGLPTEVRHVAHVTFDRFNGFLGLPDEFEPEVPRRSPSASASVFGVSTESMQLSYDSRGNSVPTILLLMQRRLYTQGGLQAEGIFRINAENSQEEFVRDQLNRGIVPDGIDVHCLAGLIKAWFRELPNGVLDSLSPEHVMQCQSEEECAQLVRLLPTTEAALLDWAINLMADVVQEEHNNKMNARNVAMVFAPNMTQMDDPLTALMYAVQVMNFLKTLIVKTLREREDVVIDNAASASRSDPSDENGHQSPSEPYLEANTKEPTKHVFATDEPVLDGQTYLTKESNTIDDTEETSQSFAEKAVPDDCTSEETDGELLQDIDTSALNDSQQSVAQSNIRKATASPSSKSYLRKASRKMNGQQIVRLASSVEKSRGTSLVSRINSRAERVEAWR